MNKEKTTKLSEKLKITIALAVSIAILIALGIFANSKTTQYKQSMNDFNISGIVISQSQDIMNAVMDVQLAFKSYVITNDTTFLKSLEISTLIVKNRVDLLKQMPLAPKQSILLDSIAILMQQENKLAYDIIVKRKYGSLEAAINLLNENAGKVLLKVLKYNIQQFINVEKQIQVEKLSKENKRYNQVINIVIISVIVAVGIILFTLFYILKIYQRLVNTERLLLKSQLRLERILDKLPIGVIIANANNNEYHANFKAVTLLGDQLSTTNTTNKQLDMSYTFTEGLNQKLSNLLFISHAIHGEENIGFNETSMRIGNRDVPFRVSAIPLYNEKGNMEYAVSVFDDISNIKQFETDLIEAKKLVEESLKIKDSFLSNISHEIRTPINAILGFAELLEKKDLGTDENEYVRIIRSAGEGLLRLLNDVLDFSKLESNMMVFEDHPVSIDGVLNSICNLFSPKAKNKNITLNYECSSNIPEIVVGDPVRLTQVISNIVGNAIKFTPKGSVLLFAKLISTNENYSIIQFKIKDSGIGISKDKLSRVFKRFEQAGTETTRLYGGTGLGLSIAKHIVQSRGGKIFVTSELGVGSIFTFTMAFKNYVAGNFKNIKPVDTITNLTFLNGLRILLVEDNILNIKLINGIFLGTGVALDVSETGEQTLAMLKKNEYDIILMDIELPDMNGYQVTKLIRNELKLHLPVIALTAHALAGEKEKCFAVGMNDYLTKPVNTKQLFEKMHLLVSPDDENLQINSESKDILTEETPVDIKNVTVADASIVDLSYLKEFSENNKAFEKEMIDLFLAQTPSQLLQLENAVDEKDYTGTKMAAHKLKSSVAIIMGSTLTTDFERLEDHALSKNFSQETGDTLSKIKSYLTKGIEQLKDLIKSEYSL